MKFVGDNFRIPGSVLWQILNGSHKSKATFLHFLDLECMKGFALIRRQFFREQALLYACCCSPL